VALKISSLYISHPVLQKELLEQVGILSFLLIFLSKYQNKTKNASKKSLFSQKV
jgi:hypothetical protein